MTVMPTMETLGTNAVAGKAHNSVSTALAPNAATHESDRMTETAKVSAAIANRLPASPSAAADEAKARISIRENGRVSSQLLLYQASALRKRWLPDIRDTSPKMSGRSLLIWSRLS